MSEFLDELARSLAKPMPRRRAVRLLAGAVVGAGLPGGRAVAALASPSVTCNPAKEIKCFCPSKNGLFFKLCCPKDGTYKCDCFSDRAQCTKIHKCPSGKKTCGDRCCDPNQECVSFSIRGTTQYVCSDKCPPGQAACGGDVCCPKGQNCLDPIKHICGVCRPGQVKCGNRCCDRGGTCCDPKRGLCCKPGEKCGSWPPKFHICCKNHSCQAKSGSAPFCCENPDEACVPQLAPGSSGFTSSNPRVCCPPERQVTGGGGSVVSCCPAGQVPAPHGGVVVGPGLGGVCCPEDSLCGTGANATCCPTGRMCCNGQCVDITADVNNCGSCGHVCAPNTVCRGGQCVLAG
jgi:hypothetical protein